MRGRGDRGRAEVYAAELAAFDGTELEQVVTFDRLTALADRLTAARWWPQDVRPDVRPARRDAQSSSTRWRAGPVVTIAADQATPATLVHELAHVLAGPGVGHGAVFRRAHVDVASEAFGADRGGWLAQAYATAGLGLGRRAWPAPAHRSRSIAL